MNRTSLLYPLGLLLLLGAAPADVLARIKLTTLPVRERVEIQLDHPQIALVEEERIVPLVKGVNPVSYTHLDVYKRQEHFDPLAFAGTNAGLATLFVVIEHVLGLEVGIAQPVAVAERAFGIPLPWPMVLLAEKVEQRTFQPGGPAAFGRAFAGLFLEFHVELGQHQNCLLYTSRCV